MALMEQDPSQHNSYLAERSLDTRHESDEIDLATIGKFAFDNWRVFLACVALGMALLVVLYFALPAKWEAAATIKIGSIPASVSSNDIAKFEVIEFLPEVVAKFTQRETIDKVIATLKKSSADEEHMEQDANLVRETLKATVVKNTNFIQVTTSAYSPPQAEKALGTAIQVILESHQQRFSSAMTRFKEKLQTYNGQIDDLKKEIEMLEVLLKDYEKLKSTSQFGQTIAAINLLSNKKTELNELMYGRSVLEDKISSVNTYPTSVVSQVYAEDSPYFPNLSLFLVIGGFFGLLLGLVCALYISYKKNHISNQA
jgi:uncharacterized protein involved in exopolysaccharide biosynthesis